MKRIIFFAIIILGLFALTLQGRPPKQDKTSGAKQTAEEMAAVVSAKPPKFDFVTPKSNSIEPTPEEILHLNGDNFTHPPQSIIVLTGEENSKRPLSIPVEIWFKLYFENDQIEDISIVFSTTNEKDIQNLAIKRIKSITPIKPNTSAEKGWYYHRVAVLTPPDSMLLEDTGVSVPRIGVDIKLDQEKLNTTGLLDEAGKSIISIDAAAVPALNDFAAVDFATATHVPAMVYQEAPEYPRKAKFSGKEGTVWIRALVLENGTVEKAQVLKSSQHKELDQSALKNAYRCGYCPGYICGEPVKAWVAYSVKYELGK